MIMNFVTWFLLANCLAVSLFSVAAFKADASLRPILLFPGMWGSQIEAKLDMKDPPVHYFCARKTGWYKAWLNWSLFLPGIVDCHVDAFRLHFNETTGRSQNRPGVQTRIPGFGDTKTVEYLGTFRIGSGEGLFVWRYGK